jgi:hypothetical protein
MTIFFSLLFTGLDPVGPSYSLGTDHIENTSSNSAAGMCLLSQCLAMEISSGSTILALKRHVTTLRRILGK